MLLLRRLVGRRRRNEVVSPANAQAARRGVASCGSATAPPTATPRLEPAAASAATARATAFPATTAMVCGGLPDEGREGGGAGHGPTRRSVRGRGGGLCRRAALTE